MTKGICWLCVLLSFGGPAMGAPDYQDVAKWVEVDVPPDSDSAAREAWETAAAESPDEWRVSLDGAKVLARLDLERGTEGTPRPWFSTPLHEFRGIETYAAVDDGWLIGVNRGEFGSDVYWYSRDGKKSYRFSDAHIVAFFSRADGVYAIEGMAHLESTEGSIVRFAKSKSTGHWEMQSVLRLPSKPHAISLRKDGTMFVTMADSILAISPDLKVDTLVTNPPWEYLDPGSSVLTQDEHKLYIGMEQFVGELDLDTKRMRMLIPSELFLNRLSEDEKGRIRKKYGE